MDEKREWRDEIFEASTDAMGRAVRVANTLGTGHIIVELRSLNMNSSMVVYLTTDEADQLAEMLRLSARGLRVDPAPSAPADEGSGDG